jgi:hypothetical protein
MAGVCFRPLADSNVTSEFACVWLTGTDHPARDLFLKVVQPAAAGHSSY